MEGLANPFITECPIVKDKKLFLSILGIGANLTVIMSGIIAPNTLINNFLFRMMATKSLSKITPNCQAQPRGVVRCPVIPSKIPNIQQLCHVLYRALFLNLNLYRLKGHIPDTCGPQSYSTAGLS